MPENEVESLQNTSHLIYKIVFCCDNLKKDFNCLASVRKLYLVAFYLKKKKFIEQRLTFAELMSRYILIYRIMLVNHFPH